jgi:hypothetical protein
MFQAKSAEFFDVERFLLLGFRNIPPGTKRSAWLLAGESGERRPFRFDEMFDSQAIQTRMICAMNAPGS